MKSGTRWAGSSSTSSGRSPTPGEEADFQGLRFRAEEVQGRRVATVVITRVPVEVLEDDVTDDG